MILCEKHEMGEKPPGTLAVNVAEDEHQKLRLVGFARWEKNCISSLI